MTATPSFRAQVGGSCTESGGFCSAAPPHLFPNNLVRRLLRKATSAQGAEPAGKMGSGSGCLAQLSDEINQKDHQQQGPGNAMHAGEGFLQAPDAAHRLGFGACWFTGLSEPGSRSLEVHQILPPFYWYHTTTQLLSMLSLLEFKEEV